VIKDFFKFNKAKEFFNKLKVGGRSILSFLFTGKESQEKNTANAMLKAYDTARKNNLAPDELLQTLEGIIKQRKRSILRNLRGIMLAARQDISNRFSGSKHFVNYGVFDSKQTKVCGSYMGQEWHMPWSEIPSVEKPPRTSGAYHNGVLHHVHNCRSRIIPYSDGVDTRSAIEQFNDLDSRAKRDILIRKKIIKAYEAGELEINTTKQLLDARLVSQKKLGL